VWQLSVAGVWCFVVRTGLLVDVHKELGEARGANPGTREQASPRGSMGPRKGHSGMREGKKK
jgi:hypothetical protein